MLILGILYPSKSSVNMPNEYCQGFLKVEKDLSRLCFCVTHKPTTQGRSKCGEDMPGGIAEWVGLRGKWIAHIMGLKRKGMPSHHIYRLYRRTLATVIAEEEFRGGTGWESHSWND
jgi:hypothetical protein